VVGLVPRVVIAAPSSGSGKTTVAVGLIAALRARGSVVAPFKVGPDYIDPSYHGLAAGRVGRNLDAFLCGEERVVPLFAHGSAGADVAVVEGVMGLFDGRGGTDEASTAHVAHLLGAPVILVVDARSMSRSVAALVHGFATYDPRVRVAGVILNMVGSDTHEAMLRASLEPQGIPVLGVIRRHDDLTTPSRHLGLVPAAERPEAALATVAAAQHIVARSVDLDALVALAQSAAPMNEPSWDSTEEVTRVVRLAGQHARPLVALAGGPAFSFVYAETTELLEATGCDVVPFDPLVDEVLPDGATGLYLGGGFPEEHVAALSANKPLLAQVKDFRGAVYAECAGALYLARTLDGQPMCGRLAADGAMSSRLTLGYREALDEKDRVIRAHEFHRTALLPAHGPRPLWWVDGQPTGWREGDDLLASYLHVHWAGHPEQAQAFAQKAEDWRWTAA
jgi:cobyrinic acid a,c-diamide synthase